MSRASLAPLSHGNFRDRVLRFADSVPLFPQLYIMHGSFSQRRCLRNRTDRKSKIQLLADFQKSTEVRGRFPGFNPGYGRMRESAQFRQFSLRKRKCMSALNHSSDNLGKRFGLINVFGDLRICCPHMFFIIFPCRHNDHPFLEIQSSRSAFAFSISRRGVFLRKQWRST